LDHDNQEESDLNQHNLDISAEDLLKRNQYIERSIKNSNSWPIIIDY